jgi:hypothetical protein
VLEQASVAYPFGFTVPLRVAPLVVIDVAVSVDTAGDADVVKLNIEPSACPSVLAAAARK